MLRRDFLALLAAASAGSAVAQEASPADLTLSEEWKEKTRTYVKAVNHGIATNAEKFPDQISAVLTRKVLRRVEALQARGWSQEHIRELFPFEADSVKGAVHDRQSRVFKIGFARDGLWFCEGDYDETPRAWLAAQEGLRRLEAPADIQTIGVSKDGKTLAVLTQDRTVSLCETDFSVRAAKAFRLPATVKRGGKTLKAFEKASDVDDLIPFDDGRALLVSGNGGQFLLRGEEAISLQRSDGERRFDMAHIDLSKDQTRIAFGHQESSHHVVDLDGKPVAELDPASSYPHCAIFNDHTGQVAFNACHFYHGATLGLDVGAFDATKSLSHGDPGVTVLNEADRVYAGVAYRNGYIWGQAHGYIRHVDGKGAEVWHHFIGGTITSLALNADQTLLAVATHAGFAAVIDLTTRGRYEHTISTAGFQEPVRYVAMDGGKIVRW